MLLLPKRWIIFCSVLCCCVFLQSCATTDKSAPEMKVGMHLDAVLEFVVEYPLTWHKDRRLVYGSKEGEVRWSPPNQPDILLRIQSFFPGQTELDPEKQVEDVLHDLVGLQLTSKELIKLPAGEAWHLTGHTKRGDIIIYLFLNAERSYLITFSTPADQSKCCEEVMERVTRSFQAAPL